MPTHILIPVTLVLISLVILCPVVVFFVRRSSRYRKELEYINMEIRRTEGAEQRHWMRKRRSLRKKYFCFRKL